MKARSSFLPFALPFITKDEINSVVETLKSGWLTTGPKTKLFEKKFAGYVGSKQAVALNSATGGLFLSLAAADIKKGDNIIITAFGAGFTWGAIYLKWAYDPK